MSTERGEFTRKFDRDILGDESAESEDREAQRRALEAEDQAVEEEFKKILGLLEYRATWLKDRFTGCNEAGGLSFRGRRFEFTQNERQVGWIEFRTRLTDSQQGIMVESYMELEGQFPKRHDYVSFPKDSVRLDRAKRFIESKLFEFAGPYQDSYGS